MKQSVVILFTLILSFCILGCGDKKSPAEKSEQSAVYSSMTKREITAELKKGLPMDEISTKINAVPFLNLLKNQATFHTKDDQIVVVHFKEGKVVSWE